MKKILSKIGGFFGTLFGLLLAFLLVICIIFLVPIDYIKYKRSSYYKVEHKKYHLFTASGIRFKLYNEIVKNGLPIKFYYNLNNDDLECGWFVYDKTLIIPDVVLEYDDERNEWISKIYDEHDEFVSTLTEFLENEVRDANEFSGQTICDKAIILLDINDISEDQEREKARKESSFLVYDENRVEVLKKFCENINL